MSRILPAEIMVSLNIKKPILKKYFINISIIGDGNCFYLCISLYYTDDQANHINVIKIIYEAAKKK